MGRNCLNFKSCKWTADELLDNEQIEETMLEEKRKGATRSEESLDYSKNGQKKINKRRKV